MLLCASLIVAPRKHNPDKIRQGILHDLPIDARHLRVAYHDVARHPETFRVDLSGKEFVRKMLLVQKNAKSRCSPNTLTLDKTFRVQEMPIEHMRFVVSSESFLYTCRTPVSVQAVRGYR